MSKALKFQIALIMAVNFTLGFAVGIYAASAYIGNFITEAK